MTATSLQDDAAASTARRNLLTLVVYTCAIFLSALLLFSVQPLFTKMVLPRLGGSPAVWSVAMAFFQSLLLAGYAYAHFLMKLSNRVAPLAIHLVLLVIAVLTLPLSIAGGWGEPPSSGTALWVFGLFAVSIGLPFFALAANNPLLQAWFVRTGHPDGADPYFLYASSNIGSFLALLSYPVLIEPLLTLRQQNLIWTGGYVVLIVLIACCGVVMLKSPPVEVAELRGETMQAAAPTWPQWGRWVFLAAIPSGLLVAVTAHISTDVAAAPLLWVLPLSLYLLTWVLVFQQKPLIPHRFVLLVQPLAVGRRDLPAGVEWRAQPAGDARRAFAVLLRHRDGLPWRTGAAAPGAAIPHRLLCRAVARRHDRRAVRRPCRAVHLLVDRRVPDPGGARGAVPAAGRSVAADEAGGVARLGSGGAGRNCDRRRALARRQERSLAGNQRALRRRGFGRSLGDLGGGVARQSLERRRRW